VVASRCKNVCVEPVSINIDGAPCETNRLEIRVIDISGYRARELKLTRLTGIRCQIFEAVVGHDNRVADPRLRHISDSISGVTSTQSPHAGTYNKVDRPNSTPRYSAYPVK
jgi:hypothetical protein